MSKPSLSIIIVNWKVKDLLQKCLRSIFDNKKDLYLEIFVVDNNSQDGSLQMLKESFPEVKVLAMKKNLGFAAANNIALQEVTSDNIFLLNPDTEITADFFDKVLTYLEANREVDILGPRILNLDSSQQFSIRRNPSIWDQILVLLKMKNICPNNKILARYLYKDFDYDKEQSVEQIMGAAMIIRKRVFEKIGLFDEKFFIWFEEVDFCKRALENGFVIKYLPSISLLHKGGESFSQKNSLKKQIVFNRSLSYYFYKHHPFWQLFIIILFIPLNIILTFLYVISFKGKR